jgi:oligoribonuclease NrnB/cAMP/cGMP phosphodiesterase (DHH superfamily)
VCRYWLESQGFEFKMVPIDYGDDFNYEFVEGDTLYFLDWTLRTKERLLELSKYCDVVVIDHHKTSEELVGLFAGDVRPDNKLAACALAAEFFLGQSFSFVDLLSKYDVWRQEEDWEQVLQFQYGMRAKVTEPDTDNGMALWRLLLNAGLDYSQKWIDAIRSDGCAILEYQRKQYSEVLANSFDIVFEGLRAIVLIGQGIGSAQFDSKWDESKYDMMMSINNIRNEYWRVSLYTTKDLDLSAIAKKWGGGGHARACGFQVKDLPHALRRKE